MTDKSKECERVTKEELVAMANSLDVVLNPAGKRSGLEDVDQFGLLVSLLKKLIRQVYG